jgi:MFS family permease
MAKTLRENWALFFGILALMLGNGLQSSLLAVRAALEGFPPVLTGIVMSGYYLGFLLGWAVVPGMIQRVGHIRVFAAFGTVASTTVLVHALLVDPYSWFVLRLITGASLCAVFITAESWLNSKSSNENRGQILAGYMIIQLGGLSIGQFLLNAAPAGGAELFILVSILVSVAVVPILLTASPAPVLTTSGRLSPRRLYEISPLGTVGIFVIGAAHGALYGGVAAIYAREIGLSVAALSLFMALTISGGVVFQWPLGWLSDRYDRRLVITNVTLVAALVTAVAALAAGMPILLFTLFFLTGGLSLPLYSLCVAHANDNMSSEEMVGASSALLLINGVGAAIGPSLAASVVQIVGAAGFPLYLSVAHATIGLFALWRMTRRGPVPAEAQGPTIPLATQTTTPVISAVAQEDAIERSPDPVEEETPLEAA